MPIIYDPADTTILAVRDRIIEKYFPEIIVADLKVDVVMATHPKGRPAIKVGGNPCAAVIQKINPKERCKPGAPDVRITIDATKYFKANPKKRAGTFHHELKHVVLHPDEDGPKDDNGQWLLYVVDDTGRPKVTLCPDDIAITGFVETYVLFGEDSIEHANFKAIDSLFGQGTLPFMAADGAGAGAGDGTTHTATTLSDHADDSSSVTVTSSELANMRRAINDTVRLLGGKEATEAVASDLDDEDEDGSTDDDQDDQDGDETDADDDGGDDLEESDDDADQEEPGTAAETFRVPAASGRQGRGRRTG
jgi:hypothetical protein